MEHLLENTWYLILFLIEIGIILLLIDAIMHIIMSAAAVFGILWLRDYLKKRKKKAKEEIVQDLTEEDFEVVNEGE